jgi:CheY-like chemotaxis protein
LNGIRLVLVEDHADALEVTRRILELHGAEVATGANGQEGLVALRILRPDVVVTDLAMPVMDGYALIRQIRALGLEGGEQCLSSPFRRTAARKNGSAPGGPALPRTWPSLSRRGG